MRIVALGLCISAYRSSEKAWREVHFIQWSTIHVTRLVAGELCSEQKNLS